MADSQHGGDALSDGEKSAVVRIRRTIDPARAASALVEIGAHVESQGRGVLVISATDAQLAAARSLPFVIDVRGPRPFLTS